MSRTYRRYIRADGRRVEFPVDSARSSEGVVFLAKMEVGMLEEILVEAGYIEDAPEDNDEKG